MERIGCEGGSACVWMHGEDREREMDGEREREREQPLIIHVHAGPRTTTRRSRRSMELAAVIY